MKEEKILVADGYLVDLVFVRCIYSCGEWSNRDNRLMVY